jgi:hypothetical protein
MQEALRTDESQIDEEAMAKQQAIELQEQIGHYLNQLSLERLQTVLDFAAYLLDKESEEATQELLEIPGLLEKIQEQQNSPNQKYVSWRELRRDV